jgi:hypothetical protein
VTDGAPRPVRPLVAAVLLTAFFGIVELPFAAFMADDLIQLAVLEGVAPATWIGPFSLYTLGDGVPEHVRTMMDAGALPWFFDPAFKMAFLRPLSSALLALDHALWGLQPIAYCAHGLLWLLALVVGFGLVLRRVLPGPTGGLALVVFAVAGVHGTLFWTATRHVVVAGALGMWAIAAHVAWREDEWRPGRVLSIVGFALALAASEAAIAMIMYLVAYEVFAASGEPRTRLRAVVPTAALVLLYLLLFVTGGYGANGGGYLDPLRAPIAFVAELPQRWLFLSGALVAGGNADIWVLRPDLRWPLTLLAAAIALGFGILLRTAWGAGSREERRGAGWLVAGCVAAMIPFAGSPIGSRCLVLPMVGGSVAIALVLRHWWRTRRERSGFGARLAGAACVLFAVVHLVQSPIQRLGSAPLLRWILHDRLVAGMQDVELDPARVASQDVVVLQAPDLVIGLHAFFFRLLERMPMSRSWRTLSWAPCAHLYRRTADDTLVLELGADALDAPTLATGDVVEMRGLRAEVVDRGALGPTDVVFRFDRSLDDPSLWLLTWRDGRLRHVVPPPVGQEMSGPAPAHLW